MKTKMFENYIKDRYADNKFMTCESIDVINDDTALVDLHFKSEFGGKSFYSMILIHTNDEIKEVKFENNLWTENRNIRDKSKEDVKQLIKGFISLDRWDYQKSNFMNIFDEIISFDDIQELTLDEVKEILTEKHNLNEIKSYEEFENKFGFRSFRNEIITWEKIYNYRNFEFKLKLVRKFDINVRGSEKKGIYFDITQRKSGSSKFYDYYLQYECLNRDDWEPLEFIFDNMYTIKDFNPIFERKVHKNIYENEDNEEHLKPVFAEMVRKIVMHINWIQNMTLSEINKERKILDNQEKAFKKMMDN